MRKRKPKTWTCPLTGRMGQFPANGQEILRTSATHPSNSPQSMQRLCRSAGARKGNRSRAGRGLVHFSAESRYCREKRKPKTWTCPLTGRRGQSHFRGERRFPTTNTSSAAKIGTVPRERLRLAQRRAGAFLQRGGPRQQLPRFPTTPRSARSAYRSTIRSGLLCARGRRRDARGTWEFPQ